MWIEFCSIFFLRGCFWYLEIGRLIEVGMFFFLVEGFCVSSQVGLFREASIVRGFFRFGRVFSEQRFFYQCLKFFLQVVFRNFFFEFRVGEILLELFFVLFQSVRLVEIILEWRELSGVLLLFWVVFLLFSLRAFCSYKLSKLKMLLRVGDKRESWVFL